MSVSFLSSVQARRGRTYAHGTIRHAHQDKAVNSREEPKHVQPGLVPPLQLLAWLGRRGRGRGARLLVGDILRGELGLFDVVGEDGFDAVGFGHGGLGDGGRHGGLRVKLNAAGLVYPPKSKENRSWSRMDKAPFMQSLQPPSQLASPQHSPDFQPPERQSTPHARLLIKSGPAEDTGRTDVAHQRSARQGTYVRRYRSRSINERRAGDDAQKKHPKKKRKVCVWVG